MSNLSDSGMRVFGGIKNGLELPKINVNKQQESNNGKEVNLNLKHSNTNSTTSGGVSMKNSKPLKNSAKCTPKKSGFTMKNSDNPDNTHSQTKRNGLNFELSLTPKGKENKINGANNGEGEFYMFDGFLCHLKNIFFFSHRLVSENKID